MGKQYTPEELTQLHQVLYEILEEIVRICDKHNIPYFVDVYQRQDYRINRIKHP